MFALSFKCDLVISKINIILAVQTFNDFCCPETGYTDLPREGHISHLFSLGTPGESQVLKCEVIAVNGQEYQVHLICRLFVSVKKLEEDKYSCNYSHGVHMCDTKDVNR